MELFFLFLLVILMAVALGSGFPVAFALPGSAIITIGLAGLTGWLFEANPSAYFHSSGPYEWLSAGVTNLRGVYWEPERDTLIAIPLFIFMGLMLQRSKVAEDLLLAMAQLFGPVPGGLGISVVFVGALLAATTGIVGATVVAMGLISLPSMLRNNYSPSLATGTIAASGTLGQIIPPSIVLIILADQLASASDQASSLRKSFHKEVTGEMSMPSFLDVTSTSAGEMFLGALAPGLVLVGVYMLYILVSALLFPKVAPAVGFEGKMDSKFWLRISVTLIPPLTLIFLVLGSILSGVATVNQAGAIGAAGAVFMGSFRLSTNKLNAVLPPSLAIISILLIFYCLANYEMNFRAADTAQDYFGLWLGVLGSLVFIFAFAWGLIILFKIEGVLKSVMLETAKTTSLVFIILLGAAVLTSAFRAFGGEELVRDFLNSLPGGFWTKFIIVMAVIFVLGFFLDFIEIAVVVVPIVAPILLADPSANITAVWLGVMIGLNIQTSFLTPPFGFALFYLRGVAPAVVKTIQMYKGVVPFIMLQVLALFIVGSYPPLVNYLPQRTALLSDSAPPPKNPKLQHCLEKYTWSLLSAPDSRVAVSIENAKNLDLSVLPEKLRLQAFSAFDSAKQAMTALEIAREQERKVEKAAEIYRPQLAEVRQIERNLKALNNELKEVNGKLSRSNQDSSNPELVKFEREKVILESEIIAETALMPEGWEAAYQTFSELVKDEAKGRMLYRRQADASYSGVKDIVLTIESYEDLLQLENNLSNLKTAIKSDDPKIAAAKTKEVMADLNSIAGASKIKSLLSKTRKALRKKKVDADKVEKLYQKALDEYRAQLFWLSQSQGAVLTGLKTYLDDISGTIGARQLDAMPRDTALFIAKCSAQHRDISLNF